MLAHQCSARAYLVILVAAILSVFLLTAHRLHNGQAVGFAPVTEDPTTNKPADDQHAVQQPPATQIPDPTVYKPDHTDDDDDDDDSADSTGSADRPRGFCGDDWAFLRSKDLDLSDNIVYSRRCVKQVHGDVDRDVVANISSPLISDTQKFNLKGNCAKVPEPPCEPLTLHVPPAYPAHEGQYRHLLFGVASSYERLQDALPVFEHWLSGTGAQIVFVVSDADSSDSKVDLPALEAAYRHSNIEATVKAPRIKTAIPRLDTPLDAYLPSPAPVEQLHFLLIDDMLEIATSETEWLGVLDDDTFFPALHPLSLELRKYDHTRPAWLGQLADNWVSVKVWGYMAYGGAGSFLSVPLAKQISPHLDDCLRTTTVPSGDGMLKDCLYAHVPTKLTLVDGLYQHDIRGDASGFFESGRRVLSIHHWKSWYHAPVDKMAAVTSVCGDCFLQRWRLGEDTLFTNGYSVTTYPGGVDKLELDKMEGTIDGPDDKYDFFYAPFRPKLGDKEKKSYRLVGVGGGIQKGEKFRQVYVHRASRDSRWSKPVDEIVELVWEV